MHMISTNWSSLIGAAPKGVRRAEREPDVASDGFRSSEQVTRPGYGPMAFPEQAAEIKTRTPGQGVPWRGVLAGTLFACSLAGGVAGAATAQTMPSHQDIQAQRDLEFLDHAGHLYQSKGGLFGGEKPATPEEALKQLKGGNSVSWNRAEGFKKQTIQSLSSLSNFAESVRQQSQR